MENLKPNDGAVYTHGTLHQNEIGGIDLQAMSFTGIDGHILTAFSVVIRSWKAGHVEGWGKRIFDGSLEDFIDIFRAGLEARKEATNG